MREGEQIKTNYPLKPSQSHPLVAGCLFRTVNRPSQFWPPPAQSQDERMEFQPHQSWEATIVCLRMHERLVSTLWPVALFVGKQCCSARSLSLNLDRLPGRRVGQTLTCFVASGQQQTKSLEITTLILLISWGLTT